MVSRRDSTKIGLLSNKKLIIFSQFTKRAQEDRKDGQKIIILNQKLGYFWPKFCQNHRTIK